MEIFNVILVKISEETKSLTRTKGSSLKTLIENYLLKNPQWPYMIIQDYVLIKEYSSDIINDLTKRFGIDFIAPAKLIDIKSLENDISDYINYYIMKFKAERRRLQSFFINQQIKSRPEVLEKIREILIRKNLAWSEKYPDLVINIMELDRNILVFSEIIKCPGGYPRGIGGKVVCLMSGGPDSTLAAWLTARNGAQIIGIYLDFGVEELRGKARLRTIKAARRLFKDWEIPGKLYIVPFSDIVRKIAKNCKPRNFFVLLKRYMIRVAELICEKEGAEAIVTGEIIGEHASQTAWNLNIISLAAEKYPIIRPVISMDKNEILHKIREIDMELYDIVATSIEACVLFERITPTTRAKIQEIERDEELINITAEDLRHVINEAAIITM